MTFSAVSGHLFDEEFQLCSDICLPHQAVTEAITLIELSDSRLCFSFA